MSSAPANKNPKKMPNLANVSRPGGCSSLAVEKSPKALVSALLFGNRATRREAKRNGKKLLKKEGML